MDELVFVLGAAGDVDECTHELHDNVKEESKSLEEMT